mmetsp:Transcript_26904/g.70764  ORF Transcript_26904/g.70764 Transcript_26904/m.70764 type:complete len:85 (-) Transcript_26904:566-820(-)
MEGEQPRCQVTPRPRKREKSNETSAKETISLTSADLRAMFHLPLAKAACSLDISPSSLKIICRKLGVRKWPFREVCHFESDEVE